MNKYILFVAMFFMTSLYTFGQGEMDAFKFSRNDQMGTARSMAMGGAFGALGADVTGVAQNPAGIGVYRSSEIMATLGFTSDKIETNTAGIKANSDSKFKFAFDNIAYMGYTSLTDDVFKSVNFGFSYNRLKNFDRIYLMRGNGRPSSITDYIAAISNSYSSNELEFNEGYDPYHSIDPYLPWLGILGYNAEIINNIQGSSTEYESAWPADDFNAYRFDNGLKALESGRIESYDFTMGTNISDMLYLGVTFSITDIYHELSTDYREDFIPTQSYGGIAGKVHLTNWEQTTGSGYQVSAGVIFRPVDGLRLGFAYHSPTWYNLENIHNGYLDALLPDGYDPVGFAPDAEKFARTIYSFQTPSRLVASLAGILGTKAILSVDYEYSNFGNMKLKDAFGFEYEDNRFIREDFKGAGTLKAGIEYRITPQFSIRGGYSWAQSPLEAEFRAGNREVMFAYNSTMPHFTLDGDANSFSCGIGYRFTPNFYMDFAFSFKTQTNQLYTYSPGTDALFYDDEEEDFVYKDVNVLPSEFKNNTYRGLVTLGYRF